MNETRTHYTIRQIAELTGLSAYTLRYYEDIGLIDPVTRAPNGHRRYSEDDYGRIVMLGHLRLTGMSLDDMKLLIDLYRLGDEGASERLALMQAHREKVQAQVDELCRVLEFIDYKINIYREQDEASNERRQNHNNEVSHTG